MNRRDALKTLCSAPLLGLVTPPKKGMEELSMTFSPFNEPTKFGIVTSGKLIETPFFSKIENFFRFKDIQWAYYRFDTLDTYEFSCWNWKYIGKDKDKNRISFKPEMCFYYSIDWKKQYGEDMPGYFNYPQCRLENLKWKNCKSWIPLYPESEFQKFEEILQWNNAVFIEYKGTKDKTGLINAISVN